MFPNDSGVLFFGAEDEKPVAWNDVILDTRDLSDDERNKVYATMRYNQTVSFNCSINKNGIKNLMELLRGFKLAKGPARNRMIRRARKMQTNYNFHLHIQKGR